MPTLARTDLPLPLVRRGKVRDVYDVGGDMLLLVATDRVSAFDVVMPQPVPGKGEVLTLISAWWFARTADLIPNHFVSVDPERVLEVRPELADTREQWERRSMLVRRTDPFPIECVVRGYVAGSAWAEYARAGTLAGEALPAGLLESGRLERPLFSPATKAEHGHDENITFDRMRETVGDATAERLRDASLAIYERGRTIARDCGILIADTKFEFGRDSAGQIRLIDEVLTPDSSRFWPAERYQAGRVQESFDKQPLRDHLEGMVQRGEWTREPPGPELPEPLLREASERYQDVFRRLTRVSLDEVPLDRWGGA